MLEKTSEKDIVETAEYDTKKESKEFMMMLRSEYSITSALDVIETWIKIAEYSYRREEAQSILTLYIMIWSKVVLVLERTTPIYL